MMMIFCGFFLGVAWAMFGFLVWDGIKFRKELKARLDRTFQRSSTMESAMEMKLDLNNPSSPVVRRFIYELRKLAKDDEELASVLRSFS